jgi:heat shock protein HslJ
VRVAFELRDHGGGMRWQAACNIAGADLAVGPRRLRVTLQGATSMGCQPDAHEQDDWLAAFFDADPHWLLQDSTLRLHTDEIVIELTETAYW